MHHPSVHHRNVAVLLVRPSLRVGPRQGDHRVRRGLRVELDAHVPVLALVCGRLMHHGDDPADVGERLAGLEAAPHLHEVFRRVETVFLEILER